MNDYNFGNFLFTLRSEKELSQSQLGEMLGVTNKAVSKWENGSAKPNTKLLPKIAQIFDISVEELFACKRFEIDSEYEQVKQYLGKQKKKFSILASVFLSILVICPFLIMEFTVVLECFNIPDDVIGPLGATCLILLFFMSLTAFIIYRKNYKNTLVPSDFSYSDNLIATIKNGVSFSGILLCCILMFMLPIDLMFQKFASDPVYANIFLSVASFISILLFGTFICFSNIKHLLKIKTNTPLEKINKQFTFSKYPRWVKISCIVSFPLIIIIAFTTNHSIIVNIIALIVSFFFLVVTCIYNKKNK